MAAIYEKGQYYISGGGGALDTLTDVNITNPSNNQVLKYNSTSQKWENGTGGGGIDYSTDEQDTGLKWIDDKPIYQKTVNCGELPNTTEKVVAHNSSNIDAIINTFGFAMSSNGLSLPLPYADNSNTVICLASNKTNIIINTKDNMSAYLAYVTIQYTKTS